jgi:hypothetical protein
MSAEETTATGRNQVSSQPAVFAMGCLLHGQPLQANECKRVGSRKIVFQMAEVAVPRELFGAILKVVGRLRLPAAASEGKWAWASKMTSKHRCAAENAR